MKIIFISMHLISMLSQVIYVAFFHQYSTYEVLICNENGCWYKLECCIINYFSPQHCELESGNFVGIKSLMKILLPPLQKVIEKQLKPIISLNAFEKKMPGYTITYLKERDLVYFAKSIWRWLKSHQILKFC